jgi:outer membrane protein assembly factor BamB
MFKRILAIAVLAVVLHCSTVKGWFGKKDDGKADRACRAGQVTPTVTVSKLWSANAGGRGPPG